jgi:Zn finger protein HypA/HybF involved in hydrogenase expression
MHDVHAADAILKVVLAEAKKNKLKKVNTITIELGSIIEHGEEINPSNLKFNLKMLGEGTLAEGALIEIKKTAGHIWKLVSIDGE